MKKKYLIVMCLIILSSCGNKQKVINNTLSMEICEAYKTHFFDKYKGYQVNNTKQKGIDFIADYKSFCKIGQVKSSDYEIIQAYQIFKTKDSVTESAFDYSLIKFSNVQTMDSVIHNIKSINCIDDASIKVQRIYKLGSNLIIGASCNRFDIADYENFLLKEFNKSLTIEVINASN